MTDALEQWLPIVGHPYYEVSNIGRVRSLSRLVCFGNTTRTTPSKVLKLQIPRNGYPTVVIGETRFLVHRLVAIAFTPGDHSLTVNHKNGVRSSNAANNLEWVSMGDNHRHAFRTLGRDVVRPFKPVLLNGVEYPSINAVAAKIGCSAAGVTLALQQCRKIKGNEVHLVQ